MPFTLTMPKMSPTMEEGTIAKWHKKPGDFVEVGDLLLEVATDKATVEYNAIDSGWLREILVTENGEAGVNQPIAILSEDKDESIADFKPEGKVKKEVSAQSAPATAPMSVAQPPVNSQRVMASPLAKKVAQQKGIDLAAVQGSGPRGRIMSRDLSTTQIKNASIQTTLPSGAFEEEKLTPMRKAIAQRLQQSKATIPHFYLTQEIDAEPLFSLREQLKKGEVNVTFNDFVVRACALALRDHPHVNSGFNPQNNTMIRFKTIDISIAVSLESGLITPIIRQADHKSVVEIGTEAKALAAKARDGKLQEQEYMGGSFTISNLGMYGITNFQAIINPPQAANLAVGAIRDIPVVKEGIVVPGKVMSLTLSADHRVVDGAVGAEFLRSLRILLENPVLLLV